MTELNELRVHHSDPSAMEKINWLPGDRVRLWPESAHEGPHPDDQFGPEGEIVGIVKVDRHSANPTWVVGFIVRGDDGELRGIPRSAVMSFVFND
jgi:hypothetical protein